MRLSAFPTALALTAALLLLGSGCARRETAAAAGIRSHTLLVGNSGEPATLDPHLATIGFEQVIIGALFEGLTALDERTSLPVPAAAESWTTSPDGLTWTFHLRAGLLWSNGEPLTAGDFVASWQRVLNPAVAAEGAGYLYVIRNAEDYNAGRVKDFSAVGVAAPDDRTVVVTLAHPVPYLASLAALPSWYPVNPRTLAKYGALDQHGADWTRPGNLVGNGAYVLEEWSPNARLVVVRNARHRDAPRAALERIVFFPIENPAVEERNFRAGQLHLTANLPVTKVAAWRQSDAARLRVDPIAQANFLRFNTTRAPFGDPRVRRAFALAISRDLLAGTVLQASRMPARSLTPPGTGAYTACASVPTDFASARRLLAEAGFPEGRGLPPIEIAARQDEISPRVAEALQATWLKELGVRVQISQAEFKTWIQNQQTLNYSISTASWIADYLDPVTYLGLFTADSAYNWTGWEDAAYDGLLAEAARTSDVAARLEILQRAEERLLAEAPVAPVFVGAQTYLIHPAVRNWLPAPLAIRRFQLIDLAE